MIKSIISIIKDVLSFLIYGKVRDKSQPTKDDAFVDIHGCKIQDGSDYFHPNQVKGIPVYDTDSVLEQHRGYINEIERICGVGDHRKTEDGKQLRKELFEMVIRRFIEYVHLLPASESHHHSVPGGMLIHSLETSSWALRSAQDSRPATSGMLDVDKQLEPAYHYAAWVGGLMHDIGKLVADMNVFAVSTYDKETNRNIKVSSVIPHWHPEKESLISWAKRYDIATYSVSFKGNRIHNQHNTVTSSLIAPILGNGAALDRLLTSPINVHHELSKVLNGTDSKCDYLKKAIRVGDNKSTSENLKIFQHLKMGQGKLSQSAMIFRAIQWSRPKWSINKTNGHAWIIGSDVYLRYTSAFDVIQKEAENNGYHVASKGYSLFDVMADSNMLERYDEKNWLVKYVGGVFTASDIEDIRSGEKSVRWESIIKVMWRGVVFGSDPVPDSAPGIMLLPDDQTMILVRTDGSTQEFEAPIAMDVNESPDIANLTEPNINKVQQKQPVVIENDTEESEVSSTDATSITSSVEITHKVKPMKKIITEGTDSEQKSNTPKHKELKFKNDPANKKVQDHYLTAKQVSQQSIAHSSLSDEVIEFWQEAIFVKNPSKGIELVHLNNTAALLGMTTEALATKARQDGVVIPNQAAPLKIVTIYNNEPCLHISVSPSVVKKDKPEDIKIEVPMQIAQEASGKSKKQDVSVDIAHELGNQDGVVWEDAKKQELDCGLDLVVGTITSQRTLGYGGIGY